jgi:hypothetical protein
MKQPAQATTKLINVAPPVTAPMAEPGSMPVPGHGEPELDATPKHSARKHEGIEEER